MTHESTHHYNLCESIAILMGTRSDFEFLSIFFGDLFFLSKQNSPRWDAAFAVSHLGLYCLPMSHKKVIMS